MLKIAFLRPVKGLLHIVALLSSLVLTNKKQTYFSEIEKAFILEKLVCLGVFFYVLYDIGFTIIPEFLGFYLS